MPLIKLCFCAPRNRLDALNTAKTKQRSHVNCLVSLSSWSEKKPFFDMRLRIVLSLRRRIPRQKDVKWSAQTHAENGCLFPIKGSVIFSHQNLSFSSSTGAPDVMPYIPFAFFLKAMHRRTTVVWETYIYSELELLTLSGVIETPCIICGLLLLGYVWETGVARPTFRLKPTCWGCWLLGSPASLPQEHLTVWPFTSVLWVATIACVAASFVANLKREGTSF